MKLVISVEKGVCDALREEILELRLAPGAKLQLEELAERYEVSITPIRHALRQLQNEGLVTSIPRRGARVAELTVDEVQEIQAIRMGVETLLARLGAERCDDAGNRALQAALERVDKAFAAGDLGGYLRAQAAFRNVCYQAADRPRLYRVVSTQRQRAERYLRFLYRDTDALAQSRGHQLKLVEACARQDGAGAEKATREALVETLGNLTALLGAASKDDA